jgi:hypothetical protein
MIPGYAATKFKTSGISERVPVAEYNKRMNKETSDPTKLKKPKHPFAQILVNSGLDKDDCRGITTSSSRRETPSMVFGISTPGPLDKTGKQGTIGKKEHAIKNAYVSRLGGSTFVMDDGDDKFVRDNLPSAAGPTYKAVEQGEKPGKAGHSIPHNELVRIRTRTGHQILLHNSEDLIYISHGSGNSWIEMTSNGKIDVYAKDSISFHTDQDFNVTAGRDINFTAVRNVNTSAGGHIWETSGGTNETKAGGNILETAPQIHMNGPAAATAPKANRVPTKEPWAGHENLDPTKVTPKETEASQSPKDPTPALYKKYTTSTDTFNKVKPPEKKK